MEDAPVTSENMSESGPIETAEAEPSAAVEQRLIDQLVDSLMEQAETAAYEAGRITR